MSPTFAPRRLALALLTGLLTTLAAGVTAAACLAGLWFEFRPANDAAMSLHIAGYATALWLTGPGAYAIDARRHGRREIIVPRRPAAPG